MGFILCGFVVLFPFIRVSFCRFFSPPGFFLVCVLSFSGVVGFVNLIGLSGHGFRER